MAKKYIDADLLRKEIERQKHMLSISIQSQGDYGQSCHIVAYEDILSLIDSLQQEQESVAEQFAKIVREHLSEIGNNAQSQFEQLYFEITGTKMYGGYND